MKEDAPSSSKKQKSAKQIAARRRAIQERVQAGGSRRAGSAKKASAPQRREPNDHVSEQDSAHAAVIAEYHALEKRIARTAPGEELERLKAEQLRLGGLEIYQQASLTGAAQYGETSKWLMQQLDGLSIPKRLAGKRRRLLDVGAIAGTSYFTYLDMVDPTYIDLNPQATHVIQADFLQFPLPSDPTGLFDVVCLSLVINFVGSIPDRTEMLRRAHDFLEPDGLLFVVLPLACLANSRYMDHDRFTGILSTLGWTVQEQHDSALLTHWLLSKAEGNAKLWPRKEIRKGVKRNNFVLMVKQE